MKSNDSLVNKFEMNQSVSFVDILNNPRHSTKKELRPPGSQPRKRPPKLTTKRKSSRRLFATLPPISLMSSENESFCEIYDESQNISYFDQCFELIEKIGEGSFGEVYRVKSKENGQYYAVKVLKVSVRGEFDREDKIAEVRNYECVPQHENIINLVNAWEQDDYVYLQMELGYTSLEQYAEDNHEITEQQLWNILLDMLLALKNLHDSNLVHLDVKLENIIISESGTCKLSDFGILINLKDNSRLRNAMEGDAKYLAAELMDGKFTKAADVFSLGISMLELASDLELPSHGQLWHNLRNGIFPDHITKHVPKELLNIIRRMMTKDHKKRPSVKTLLKHPRLKSMLKQRKDAKAQGKEIDGRLTPPSVTMMTPTSVVLGTPVTPPNNGFQPSNNNVVIHVTPTAGYSTPHFSLCSSIDSSLLGSCGREFHSQNISCNAISSTPYVSPLPSHSKYSKNIICTSAKKLDFLNDM